MQNAGFETALGTAIRARRMELGFSQEDVADKTALHRTYISSIERGERNVSLVNIVLIANALEMGAWELLKSANL